MMRLSGEEEQEAVIFSIRDFLHSTVGDTLLNMALCGFIRPGEDADTKAKEAIISFIDDFRPYFSNTRPECKSLTFYYSLSSFDLYREIVQTVPAAVEPSPEDRTTVTLTFQVRQRHAAFPVTVHSNEYPFTFTVVSSLKPKDTTSLEPKDTSSLEPKDTTSLEPKDTSSLEPKDTTSLEPKDTSSLEPKYAYAYCEDPNRLSITVPGVDPVPQPQPVEPLYTQTPEMAFLTPEIVNNPQALTAAAATAGVEYPDAAPQGMFVEMGGQTFQIDADGMLSPASTNWSYAAPNYNPGSNQYGP